jgi:hypothetical protein
MSGRMMFSLSRLRVAMVVAVVLGGFASRADARPRTSHRVRGTSNVSGGSPSVIARKKVAIFAFDGEGAEPLRDQVVQLFRANRMDVATNLLAPDRSRYVAEQFRDLGAALDLSLYVQGRIRHQSADRAVAVITVRSGVTGRPIASVRFEGARHGLAGEVREKLWKKVHRAVARACSDASHGRRRHNEPTRIEAGTPL